MTRHCRKLGTATRVFTRQLVMQIFKTSERHILRCPLSPSRVRRNLGHVLTSGPDMKLIGGPVSLSTTRKSCVVALSVGVIVGAVSGLAQTPAVAPSLQNQPAPLSQSVAPDSSSAGSAVSSGPTVTPTLGVGSIPSSSLGKSFGTAGRGLPGMPGGPPVNSALGAQDPTGKYMSPPVIPPLLCDPAVDLPC